MNSNPPFQSPLLPHKPFKGVLFDLDGTLIDSLTFTFNAFNHAWGQFGVPKKSPAEIMQHFGPGERKIFENILGSPEKAIKADEYYLEYTESRLSEAPLFENMEDMLSLLVSEHIPFGIVTGRGRETTEALLKHKNLLHKVPVLICHEDVSSSKPSPEGIQKAAKLLKLSSDEVIYVGDMVMDIKAAKRAPCAFSIAVQWCHSHQHEMVSAENPDLSFKHPKELLEFVKSLKTV